MEWFILFIIGTVSGILGSLVGLGGGIITVPALLFLSAHTSLLSNISPQIAVGTSLFVIIFTGLSSTISYMKRKVVDQKSGLLFFLASAPGGITGAWVNKYLDVQAFATYFGMFMIVVSILLIVRNQLKPIGEIRESWYKRTLEYEGKTVIYGYPLSIGFAIAFIVGFTSGLFGIGGGALMVPAMILLFRFPPHTAVATSMFLIFLSSIVTSITHIAFGNVNWLFVIALVPGAWIGAKLGVRLNQILKSATLIHTLRIILMLLGLRLIFQGI